ncbi:uncharacterized protein KQ657_004049 [Scheffersomyces spartinae]|uniref:SET domain-containing protein n=1 Tax=Scheffersomyces spartinae TaxID=45513 RepID=A0A9P8AJL8_9ASCO|nr:uncharacterized protein KQ657_004049 [Scheffersomyces spartinae]KAG7194940.1 hypothetical protein KQ657_004049 [Scheffersomyces spartinae]
MSAYTLSPYFRIDQTKYGGRGAFANTENGHSIPEGTIVLRVPRPLSSSIQREFRKEVCQHCFTFQNGKNLKTRLTVPLISKTISLYFCSSACLKEFQNYDDLGLLTSILLEIERHYSSTTREYETTEVKSNLTQVWGQLNKWSETLARMKPSKRLAETPVITNDEYSDLKYTATTIFALFKYQKKIGILSPQTSHQYILEMNELEHMRLELGIFETLQSNITEKTQRYPYLSTVYGNIFKFLKIHAPNQLQPFVTTETVGAIIGRHLSNAFGIWCPDEGIDEFFGFAVYPLASFFNHSCIPNLKRVRTQREVYFITTKEIFNPDEELCINYGNSIEENVQTRQLLLREWFFECGCPRCTTEQTEECT